MSRYSKTVSDHAVRPRNWGQLDSPELVGVAGVPGKGRYIVFYLSTDGNQISNVRFQCHGCGATIATGSVLSEIIDGLTIDDCLKIDADHLLEVLGGLPPDKKHAAGFAISALKLALSPDS